MGIDELRKAYKKWELIMSYKKFKELFIQIKDTNIHLFNIKIL